MNKRFISWIISISLILSFAITSFADSSSINENTSIFDSKEKYINYLEQNPETERQIIVKFKSDVVASSEVTNNSVANEQLSTSDIAIDTIEKLDLTAQCSVMKTIDETDISVFEANTDNVEILLETLNSDENVIYAQPDYKVIATENVSESRQWTIQNYGQTVDKSTGEDGFDIDLPEAWEITQGTENIVVGIIDTGIDISHQDLKNNIWTNTNETLNGIDDDGNGYVDDINGWDFVSDDNTVYDMDALDEHGTHMAGIIAANGICERSSSKR